MWEQLNRIIKPNGAIVLFGSEPFSSALRMSNIKNYKYDWIWEKEQGVNFQLCRYQPLKIHEIISVFSLNTHYYKPNGLIEINKNKSNKGKGGNLGHHSSEKKRNEYTQKYSNYPKSIQNFTRERGLHPTQKPVLLMEYLIKTYTNEGETVLDFTMGSGTTGVACVNTKRNFIGIEMDDNYFEIAKTRIGWSN
jgi:site-specific DNA-methyltransferase (adenine-specific)